MIPKLLPDVSFRMLHFPDGDVCYMLLAPIKYYSPRYKKSSSLPAGYESDGASGAQDVCSVSWWVHDYMCDTERWADGSPCTGLQRSTVLHDILREEGRWFRARSWWLATMGRECWVSLRDWFSENAHN